MHRCFAPDACAEARAGRPRVDTRHGEVSRWTGRAGDCQGLPERRGNARTTASGPSAQAPLMRAVRALPSSRVINARSKHALATRCVRVTLQRMDEPQHQPRLDALNAVLAEAYPSVEILSTDLSMAGTHRPHAQGDRIGFAMTSPTACMRLSRSISRPAPSAAKDSSR